MPDQVARLTDSTVRLAVPIPETSRRLTVFIGVVKPDCTVLSIDCDVSRLEVTDLPLSWIRERLKQ